MHASRFGNPVEGGYPPPPSRSIGIIELEENSKIIYMAQLGTGKIFWNKELVPHSGTWRGFMIEF